MPEEIIRHPGGGGAIIHVLRRGRSCAYCSAPGTQLCDFVMSGGKTCDRPICRVHAARGPKPDTDYCQEHATKRT